MLRALHDVLYFFEAMFGLKVNFHKSMLIFVNVNDSWLIEVASMLNCKIGKLLFIYLGLPIGGNLKRVLFWEPVFNRIKSRLFGWRSRNLSLGGRLILLKSVMSSLPVYALFLFKVPSGIISSIYSILCRFFWGGCEDHRKISWVN